MDLPWYYWTLNERFSDGVYPSFDERPEIDEEVDARNHPVCHRLRINQREDSSIFVVGRAHLPARHRQTIRQSFHRPGNYLAPPLNPWVGESVCCDVWIYCFCCSIFFYQIGTVPVARASVCCNGAMFCNRVRFVCVPNLCTCSTFYKHLQQTKKRQLFPSDLLAILCPKLE